MVVGRLEGKGDSAAFGPDFASKIMNQLGMCDL